MTQNNQSPASTRNKKKQALIGLPRRQKLIDDDRERTTIVIRLLMQGKFKSRRLLLPSIRPLMSSLFARLRRAFRSISKLIVLIFFPRPQPYSFNRKTRLAFLLRSSTSVRNPYRTCHCSCATFVRNRRLARSSLILFS